MKALSIIIAPIIIAFSLNSAPSSADIYVIVNSDADIASLNKKQCIDIFMGRTRRFDNGDKIEAIDQNKDSTIRELFYTQLTGKSLAFVNAYWARLFYTGRVQPPSDRFSTAEKVHEEVASNTRAIAYVDKTQLDNSVKVVYTIKLP